MKIVYALMNIGIKKTNKICFKGNYNLESNVNAELILNSKCGAGYEIRWSWKLKQKNKENCLLLDFLLFIFRWNKKFRMLERFLGFANVGQMQYNCYVRLEQNSAQHLGPPRGGQRDKLQ